MYVPAYSKDVRLGLRIYFIVVVTLLGIIGSQCCKCAAKVDLRNRKTVQLHRMTGWLRARDVLVCIWRLRSLPGGLWLGFCMIVVSLIALTSDLATAYSVRSIEILSLCSFDTGLVMNWKSAEAFSAPPQNGYPALIASNAQISSGSINHFMGATDCYNGIYRKVPIGNSNLCAQNDDVLGFWRCNDTEKDREFSSDMLIEDISSSLTQDGLQYNVSQTTWTSYTSGNQSTHLVLWSTSVTDDDKASFNVLVSVDQNSTLTTPKYMKTFSCGIVENNEDGAVGKILEQMYSYTALEQWANSLEAVLYRGDGTNVNEYPGSKLAAQLNVMTMVQGGSNNMLSTALPDDPLQDTYSCLVEGTEMSWAIVALAGFAALVLLITIFYWFILLIRLGKQSLPRLFRRRSATRESEIQSVPDGIFSWMLQASRENAHSVETSSPSFQSHEYSVVPAEEKDLRHWGFAVTDPQNGIARTVRKQGPVVVMEQVVVEREHLTKNQK